MPALGLAAILEIVGDPLRDVGEFRGLDRLMPPLLGELCHAAIAGASSGASSRSVRRAVSRSGSITAPAVRFHSRPLVAAGDTGSSRAAPLPRKRDFQKGSASGGAHARGALTLSEYLKHKRVCLTAGALVAC